MTRPKRAAPSGGERSYVVRAAIGSELLRRLSVYCEQDGGRSEASVVRAALATYLREKGSPNGS